MSPPRQIRVIVGEDQAFVREGIVHVLTDGGFDVVGTTADACDLVRMASAYGPDVVVADIQMPPGHADDGLQAALAIRAGGWAVVVGRAITMPDAITEGFVRAIGETHDAERLA